MNSILQLKNKLASTIESGINGKTLIPINDLQILLTNKCNLYCIMCHMCSKEHENHTYWNDAPFVLQLDEYEKLLNISFVDRLKILFFHLQPKSTPKTIIFSSAESLINNHVYEMIRYTKKFLPSTLIRIISNGTIPLKKENSDMVQLIDQIAFSVDGCTAETFEKIRTPAKFEHVMKNIKGYIQAKKDYAGKINIVLAFTLSSINAHELPGMVKLAGELGGIESLWVQPMVILDSSRNHLNPNLFTEMDKEVLAKYINDAFEISKNNGVRIDMVPSILDYAYEQKKENNTEKINYAQFTPACNYLWNGNLQIDENGIIRQVCCYMSKIGNSEIIKKYGLHEEANDYFKFYNSRKFWELRRDFLDGKCVDYCGACPLGYASYVETSSGKDMFLTDL